MDFVCSDCLRYCFMDLIQAELDYVAHEWNIHRIRPSNYNPGGIPDKLYFLPEDEGMINLNLNKMLCNY